MCSPEALDLLDKMLKYDKNLRIDCPTAMAHPYFDPIREFVAKQDAETLAKEQAQMIGETLMEKELDSEMEQIDSKGGEM